MTRPPRTATVAAMLLVAAAVACSNGSPSTQASSAPTRSADPSGPKPTKTTASPVTEVPELLDFEGSLLDGGTFRGADVAGQDVAFWFWAPW